MDQEAVNGAAPAAEQIPLGTYKKTITRADAAALGISGRDANEVFATSTSVTTGGAPEPVRLSRDLNENDHRGGLHPGRVMRQARLRGRICSLLCRPRPGCGAHAARVAHYPVAVVLPARLAGQGHHRGHRAHDAAGPAGDGLRGTRRPA